MKTKSQNDGRPASRDDAEQHKKPEHINSTRLINLRGQGIRPGESERRKDGEVWIRGEWIYIGKAVPRLGIPASHWFDPHMLDVDDDRPFEDKIRCFKIGLLVEMEDYPELIGDLCALKGKTLACWCAPKPCHGDVLVQWAEAGQAALKEKVEAHIRKRKRNEEEARARWGPPAAHMKQIEEARARCWGPPDTPRRRLSS